MIPQSETIMNDFEVEVYTYQKFFRCINPFLSWLKREETYWFEYKGNGKFEIRSDNNLGKNFEMTIYQLLTCFYPVEIESNITQMMIHAHFLGNRNFHRTDIKDIADYISKKVKIELV